MALRDIEHIVVLVLENRSFDHMLGYLGLEGYTGTDGNALDGLRHGLSNPLHRAGQVISAPPFELTGPRFWPGPHHQYEHVAVQLGPFASNPPGGTLEPTNQGFILDYATVRGVAFPEQIMGYYGKSTLSVFDALVRQYGVCDRWFSAVPGPTMPNRCFLMAGHSNRAVDNVKAVEQVLFRRTETIFDRLSKHDVSWKYYFHDAPILRFFKQFTLSIGPIRRIERFFADVAAGALPAVSWIDPNFTLQGTARLPDGGNDDHPPADVRKGQNLVARLYNALVAREALWKKTLFVVTYDEHGGFFDHVPPPERPARAPFNDPAFYRLGVRVPTLLLSPWIRKGTVWSRELEHTSILRTILNRFCPQDAANPGMSHRVDTAPDLAFALDAPAARTDCAPVAPISFQELSTIIGGASPTPIPAPPVPRSELEEQLHAIRLAVLGEGIPEDQT